MRAPIPVLLALAAWLPSVWIGGLALDDRELVEGNPLVRGALPWTAAFTRDYFHHVVDTGAWRPLASLSLRADHALYGLDPRGYHLTNVLLHALVTALAARLALRLAPRGGHAPLLGVAVFALHPALADSVAWISGRTSMLSALPVLAGALLLVRDPGRETSARPLAVAAIALVATCLGAAAKEDGALLALGLLPLVAARGARRAGPAALVGCAAGVGLVLLARQLALGQALPSAPFPALGSAGLAERLAIGGAAWIEGARLAAWPGGYPPVHDAHSLRAAVPLAPALALLLGAALFAALAAGPLLARRARPLPPAACGAALVALVAAPWWQIVPAGEVLAPRFLYLPLLVGAPLVDALLRRVLPTRGRGLLLSLAALAALGACWERARVYADRGSYREAQLRHAPGDAPAWNDLGIAREERGQLDGARAAWERASALDPAYSKPWSNLGRVLLAQGELDAAEDALRRAVALGPRNPAAHVNLGSVLLRLERARDAEAVYLRATELAPGLAPAWRGVGLARLRLADLEGARAALERALTLDPGDATARRALEGATR